MSDNFSRSRLDAFSLPAEEKRRIFKDWLDTIKVEAADRINDWEKTFIDDIERLITINKELTTRQMDKLEQIYVKYTS